MEEGTLWRSNSVCISTSDCLMSRYTDPRKFSGTESWNRRPFTITRSPTVIVPGKPQEITIYLMIQLRKHKNNSSQSTNAFLNCLKNLILSYLSYSSFKALEMNSKWRCEILICRTTYHVILYSIIVFETALRDDTKNGCVADCFLRIIAKTRQWTLVFRVPWGS